VSVVESQLGVARPNFTCQRHLGMVFCVAGSSVATRALVATVVAAALAGCGINASATAADATTTSTAPSSASATGSTSPAVPASAVSDPETALTAARQLPVKGRAPKTGYSRDEFGQAWADVDRNGCDTRNDVLRKYLTNIVVKPGTKDCVVASGTLSDPYSGKAIDFVRGQGTSTLVQIDHVVALADAWQKGAQQWTAQTREQFANDPLNLIPTSGSLNQQKGAGDAATWLPPNRAFRCEYVARQVAVKQRYHLWVTAAEKAAMVRVLSSCPEQFLPTE